MPKLELGAKGTDRYVLRVERRAQPDDVSCGPTCLYSVYRHFGDQRRLEDLLDQTRRLTEGGTLAVFLGLKALSEGYHANLFPFGVKVFDPSWWRLDSLRLREKLLNRAQACSKTLDREITLAMVEFMDQGGHIRFREPMASLFVRIIDRGHPVICGLSATWLYRQMRERPEDNCPDDVVGQSVGHFVVVCGYHAKGSRFQVVDPALNVPFNQSGRYVVAANRLITSILLGDVTRDAVLLEIWPGKRQRGLA